MNSFGWAIKQMQNGLPVMRDAWKGRGEYLKIQIVDLNSKMRTPYIYLHAQFSDIGPWTPSQADMLAIDWIEAIWPATRAHEPKRCTHPPLHRINGLCLICNEMVEWAKPIPPQAIPCTHPLIKRTSLILAAGTPSVEYCVGCCQEVRARAVKS